MAFLTAAFPTTTAIPAAPTARRTGPRDVSPSPTKKWTKSGNWSPTARPSRSIRERRLTGGSSLGGDFANSIAQKLADRPEVFDVVAHRLETRGQGDCQQQPRRVPQEAPKHQGKRDHQGIQVHTRPDDFRIQQ